VKLKAEASIVSRENMKMLNKSVSQHQQKLQQENQQVLEVYNIPTIINGMVKTHTTQKEVPLRKISKASHKIMIVGDSHARGCAATLNTLLSSKL
jgi:hypothetical protein